MIRETARVLVVDDNPDDASAIQRMLGRYHHARFDVRVAGSTQECLKTLHADGADLVILDFQMPGENGLSFLRRASSGAGLPPVIMVTGQGDERVAIESVRAGVYDYVRKDALSTETLGRAAEQALERFRVEEEWSRFDEQIMLALAEGVEARDELTGGHLQRLARYTLLTGRELGLGERELTVLKFGGLLHDIGKLAVRVSILRKPAPLTEDEIEEVRQHPIVGERICTFMHLAPDVAAVVRHHHERWDGTGYPDGLQRTETPLLARIVSVVDAFDAMRSKRPYQAALPMEEVTRRLVAGAGSQYDPSVVELFLDLVRREHIGEEAVGSRRRAA